MSISLSKTATAIAAPPRAAIYCRVSTDRQAQEGVSLDVQKQACRDYAQAQGYLLAREYVDDESSYAPRAEYSRMLQDALDGQFDTLLVYDFSRFGRDIAQSPADFARLERMGIKVVSVTSPHAGRLERNIHFTLADYYSYELGRKVKPAQIKRVQDGLWVSRPPVGYQLEPVGEVRQGRRCPKRLARDLEKSPKVARLFQLFATGGYSLNMLMREADTMGLVGVNGKPLARSNVAGLLKNPVYIGQVVYGRRCSSKFDKKGPRPKTEWATGQGQHPPIVDPATFEKVQQILARHQRNYGSLTGGKPLLTGIVYCGECGSKMCGRARWKKAGKYGQGPGRYYYVVYRCYHAETFRDCLNHSYHGGKGIENWVKAQVMRLPITEVDREAARAEIIKLTKGQQADLGLRRRALLDEKEAHIAELKAATYRLVRNEIPMAVYTEIRQEKEAAIQGLDRRLAELDNAQKLEGQAAEALAFLEKVDWADFDGQAWKEALAVLADKVVVEGRGRYRIEWRPGVAELLRS